MFRNNSIEIIPNDRGKNLTLNIIRFADQRVLIGEDARDDTSGGFLKRYTVFEIERIIGKRWDDNGVRDAIKNWNFVVVNVGGEPKIEIETGGGEKILYSPEQITAIMLQRMKSLAEAYLGASVNQAVVTVPPEFGDAQRVCLSSSCHFSLFFFTLI